MSDSLKGLRQKANHFAVYFFVFSLSYEHLTLFGQNLDFILTKISCAFLILFSLFDLGSWKYVKDFKKPIFVLILYFIVHTLSSFMHRTYVYSDFFDYLFFLNILIFLSLGLVFLRDKNVLWNSLYVFSFSNIVLSFLYFLGVGQSSSFSELEGRATIFGNNQNYLGVGLSLSALFLLYNLFFYRIGNVKKLISIVGVGPVIIFMLLTGSRTAFLLFLFGLILFLFLTSRINIFKKIVLFLFMSLFVLSIGLVFWEKLDVLHRLAATVEDGDSANRDLIWAGLLYLFEDSFLLGVGKTGYLRIIGDLSPHNAFLEVFVYTGLIGLVIFVYYVFVLFKRAIIHYKSSHDFFGIILCFAFFGVMMTGQLFDQKVVWFFMACLFERKNLTQLYFNE
jgi:O-antigen ligase